MLDICVRFGDEMDIKYNSKKSCLFKVGRNCKYFANDLIFGDDIINWSSNLKYQGAQFKSATYLKVDVSPCVRQFYASVNAIYHSIKYVTETTRLCLFSAALRSGYGRTLYFCAAVTIFYLLFSSPNLRGCRVDVYRTSTHGVALVRISNAAYAGLKCAARGSLQIQDAQMTQKIAISAPSHNFVGLYLRSKGTY